MDDREGTGSELVSSWWCVDELRERNWKERSRMRGGRRRGRKR